MEEKQTVMQESLRSWCEIKSRGAVSSRELLLDHEYQGDGDTGEASSTRNLNDVEVEVERRNTMAECWSTVNGGQRVGLVVLSSPVFRRSLLAGKVRVER